MGERGPIGKRDDERVRRNLPDSPTATVTAIGAVRAPELGDISFEGETHQLVLDLYQSIKDSAAVQYYEPTDWQFARFTLFALNQELIYAKHIGKPIGAMKLTALNQMASALLWTEGDRRRVRLEVERAPSDTAGGEVRDITHALRERLGVSG